MPAERTISTASATESTARPFDVSIAALAARQHGVVALAQLRRLGLSASGARDRVGAGRLHRVHQGVFAVGHPVLGRQGRWMAAVLACGPDAALSHRSAGALRDLRPWSGRPEVLVPAGVRRRHPGILSHRGDLRADEVTEPDGIRCTTPSRTLVDLAAVLRQTDLERVVERAERLELLDLDAVRAILDRRRGCRGVARLRLALALYEPESKFTRSDLELRFRRLCRTAGLPPPIVNGLVEVRGRSLEVDFHWPDRRVAVETDGFETHRTRAAFERDRRNQQLLGAAGWMLIRCTWSQVTGDSHDLHQAIRTALESTERPPRAERTISTASATESTARPGAASRRP